MNINNIFIFDDQIENWNFDLSETEGIAETTRPGTLKTRLDAILYRTYSDGTSKWADYVPPIATTGLETATNIFTKINPNATVKECHQVIWHTYYTWSLQEKLDIHRDYPPINGYTCLFMVHGSGPLNFYHSLFDDEPALSVDFKPNRFIIFPCHYWHRACSPVNDVRMSLGMMFTVENLIEELNNVHAECMCGLSKDPKNLCDGSHSSILRKNQY